MNKEKRQDERDKENQQYKDEEIEGKENDWDRLGRRRHMYVYG